MLLEKAAAAAADDSFWKGTAAAWLGLGGVFVGGMLQLFSTTLVAHWQRRQKLRDEQVERDRQAKTLEGERDYIRAVLARHLEAYARACAEVKWRNEDPEEQTGAHKPPEFPEWPPVSWERLGATEMMRIRDVGVRADLQRDHAEGNVHYSGAHLGEAQSYYTDGAVRMGLEAWELARTLRAEAGVEPFAFPPTAYDFAQTLKEHVQMLDEREREYEERQATTRAALTPD